MSFGPDLRLKGFNTCFSKVKNLGLPFMFLTFLLSRSSVVRGVLRLPSQTHLECV